ncbi:LysR family transcriptional regulator [Salipaludibacillus sp. HK11]|uniref:LysR family transcriptional regulator n=1 Tax=Salipaludibacillus sp. HK11 TaxID=3394320 RepID=UPI0039FCCB53
MELRHLITFRTIVEAGGFKKAADELGYAQSSVTAHVKELERELEKPLFDRMGKTISLTQAGKSFLPYASDIISLYSKSKEVISDEGPTGQLTIGASESLMIYWLPEIILSFTEKYPKVELTLKSLHYDNLEAQLKKGHIDAALLVETHDWKPSRLTATNLRNESLSVIKAVNSYNSTLSEKMLVTEYSCSWRPIVENYLKTNTNNVHKIELPSIEAIKKCVICGLGSSILPTFVVKDEIEKQELDGRSLRDKHQKIGIYSAVHSDKWLSPNLKEFLEFVKKWEE